MTQTVTQLTEAGFGNLLLYGLAEPSGFTEVVLAPNISFFPQTMGWLCVAILVVGLISYYLLAKLKYWRANRYRQLFIKQIPSLESKFFELELYRLMVKARTASNVVNPHYQVNLFAREWLQAMDKQCPNRVNLGGYFDAKLGEQWMKTLTAERQQPLACNDRVQLKKRCEHWLSHHQRALNSKQKSQQKRDTHAI